MTCPAEKPEPLLSWPNSEGIWHEVMRYIWISNSADTPENSNDWATNYDDPPIKENESHSAAPRLKQAIELAMSDYDIPGSLLEILDEECRQIAQNIAENVPQAEQDQLMDIMRRRLQDENDTAPGTPGIRQTQ